MHGLRGTEMGPSAAPTPLLLILIFFHSAHCDLARRFSVLRRSSAYRRGSGAPRGSDQAKRIPARGQGDNLHGTVSSGPAHRGPRPACSGSNRKGRAQCQLSPLDSDSTRRRPAAPHAIARVTGASQCAQHTWRLRALISGASAAAPAAVRGAPSGQCRAARPAGGVVRVAAAPCPACPAAAASWARRV